MKGKGRGQDDGKEYAIQLTDFAAADHSLACSKYSAILQRKEEDGVTVEDLDSLQFDLEYSLISVVKRRLEMENEMNLLLTGQDKKDKKSQGGAKQGSKGTGKRSKPSDSKLPVKKQKDNNGKSRTYKRPKAKTSQPKVVKHIDVPAEPAKPKNDAPNRFWASIETYFSDLNQEHVRFLEEWIKAYDNDSEYYEVPQVGKHYSYKWSIKDVQDEQKEGEKANEKLKGGSNSASFTSSDAEKLLKKFEKENELESNSSCGPLTTCLINCLIEENIAPTEDSIDTGQGVSDSSEKRPKMCLKSVKLVNSMEVEKRIQKVLEELGILDVEEPEKEAAESEIFVELSNLQQTLKALCEHNKKQKERLLKLTQDEIKRQDQRKKLQVIDAEIKDLQKKWVACKSSKKTLPVKERNQIIETIKRREELIKMLESEGIPII